MYPRRQDGYALLVVLLVLSVFVISLAKIVPGWKTEIQREREARSIDHAREYRMAIERYYHKYGRYPASIDVLAQKDGQGLRYLRQKWPDPLMPDAGAGSSDSSNSGSSSSGSSASNADQSGWEILHYGQAVTAEIVDQPPAAALGAGGGGSAPGIAGPGLSGGSGLGSGAGGASGLGSSNNPGFGGAGTGGPGAPVGGAGGIAGAGGQTGSSGMSGVTSGPGAGIGGTNSDSGGGGPVIGVASLSKKPAIHSLNGFDIPNDWQFVYNYAQDPSLRAGAPGAGSGVPGLNSGSGAGVSPLGTPGSTTGHI